MEKSKIIPTWLSHKPIIVVDDYTQKDIYSGDAKFLSLGKAQWNNEDYSAKVWRYSDDADRWSRQSEELPLPRILDLAALIIATIQGKTSNMNEKIVDKDEYHALQEYLQDNMTIYSHKLEQISELLIPNNTQESISIQPNIFSFATSELSQDAIIAWIMSWADPKYDESNHALHRLGVEFVRMIMNKGDEFVISKIDVGRQWNNIDIWAEINDDILLIIEDKVETSEHSNQLERYKQIAEEEYKNRHIQIYCAYIKTGNEPMAIIEKIRQKKYHTIERDAILKCIRPYIDNNPLLNDYYNHLNSIEVQTLSFKTLPMHDWGWYAWQGFYKELEKHLDGVEWSYVPNPSGGFLGMWWHSTEINDVDMYLQFEQKKLCFKICYEGNENRSEIRWKYHTMLMENSFNYPEIKRPDRFGAGTYMTIACVDLEHLWGENTINIEEVVKQLHEYEALIAKCAEMANN